MTQHLIGFLRDESGATAVDCSMVAGLVVVSLVGGNGHVGGRFGMLIEDLAMRIDMYLS